MTHRVNTASKQMVTQMSAVGVPQEDIATILGITEKTLRARYRVELDTAAAKANAAVGGALYNKAVGGDTTAMIFWMKTRAGWKETTRVENVELPPLLEIESVSVDPPKKTRPKAKPKARAKAKPKARRVRTKK